MKTFFFKRTLTRKMKFSDIKGEGVLHVAHSNTSESISAE